MLAGPLPALPTDIAALQAMVVAEREKVVLGEQRIRALTA